MSSPCVFVVRREAEGTDAGRSEGTRSSTERGKTGIHAAPSGVSLLLIGRWLFFLFQIQLIFFSLLYLGLKVLLQK